MQVRSGPAVVVGSGVATTFLGHGLSLVLDLGDDHLAIDLEFHPDGTGEPGVSAEETERGYRIECRNFDGEEARGSAEPVLLGELSDALFFFHFRAARHGRSPDRTVWWTVYRARKEDVGWSAHGTAAPDPRAR